VAPVPVLGLVPEPVPALVPPVLHCLAFFVKFLGFSSNFKVQSSTWSCYLLVVTIIILLYVPFMVQREDSHYTILLRSSTSTSTGTSTTVQVLGAPSTSQYRVVLVPYSVQLQYTLYSTRIAGIPGIGSLGCLALSVCSRHSSLVSHYCHSHSHSHCHFVPTVQY
jgi:hypothetical protein